LLAGYHFAERRKPRCVDRPIGIKLLTSLGSSLPSVSSSS
jgi:hypothetical protein